MVLPMLSLALLTLSVWLYMYWRRLSYLYRRGIDPQTLATSAQASSVFAKQEAQTADNLRNLFELPVLFYVLCLYIEGSVLSDNTYLVLAWVFVIARVIHSLIHCTYNRVTHRFIAYSVSSLALWAMLLRALFTLLSSQWG